MYLFFSGHTLGALTEEGKYVGEPEDVLTHPLTGVMFSYHFLREGHRNQNTRLELMEKQRINHKRGE